ncbi:MAG: hypothetical protein QXF82_05390 [Nitrososphaeria archaeon]
MMTLSWLEKEEYARKVLSQKFGINFFKRKVRLRGTNKTYEFDLVSPDGSIVGEVKGAKYKGGKKAPY